MITYVIPFNSKLVWHEKDGFHVYGTKSKQRISYPPAAYIPFVQHYHYQVSNKTQNHLITENVEPKNSKYRHVNHTHVDENGTVLFGYNYIFKLGEKFEIISCFDTPDDCLHPIHKYAFDNTPRDKYAFDNTPREKYGSFAPLCFKFDYSTNYFIFVCTYHETLDPSDFYLYINGKKIYFSEPCRDAKISPDEKFIAVVVGNCVRFYDVEIRKIIAQFDFKEPIQHLAFSSDGLTLGVLGINKLYVMDVE